MTRTNQITIGLFAGASLLALGAAPLMATHYQEISNHHTAWGISQLNALDIDTESSVVLLNPNHDTQIAAILIYGRGDIDYTMFGDSAGQLFIEAIDDEFDEVWRACIVVKLTPHAAQELDWDTARLPFWPNHRYVEAIFAPLDPVRAPGTGGKARRLADGLGGIMTGESSDDANNYALVNPLLFSLPSDSVVSGQQAAACACICERVFLLGFPPSQINSVFAPFGIVCDGEGVATCE